MSGRFITLEGGEGVGKTTNIAYIQFSPGVLQAYTDDPSF